MNNYTSFVRFAAEHLDNLKASFFDIRRGVASEMCGLLPGDDWDDNRTCCYDDDQDCACYCESELDDDDYEIIGSDLDAHADRIEDKLHFLGNEGIFLPIEEAEKLYYCACDRDYDGIIGIIQNHLPETQADLKEPDDLVDWDKIDW